MEKLRYGVLDDGEICTGVDHHPMRYRLPGPIFLRQELDVGGMRREQHLDERTPCDELALDYLSLVNDSNHVAGKPLRR